MAKAAPKDTPAAPFPAPPVSPAVKAGELDLRNDHHVWQADNPLLSSPNPNGEKLVGKLGCSASGPGAIVVFGKIQTAAGEEKWRLALLNRVTGKRELFYDGDGLNPPKGMTGEITSAYCTAKGLVVVGGSAEVTGFAEGFYRIIFLERGKITEKSYSFGSLAPGKTAYSPLTGDDFQGYNTETSFSDKYGRTPLVMTTQDGAFAIDPNRFAIEDAVTVIANPAASKMQSRSWAFSKDKIFCIGDQSGIIGKVVEISSKGAVAPVAALAGKNIPFFDIDGKNRLFALTYREEKKGKLFCLDASKLKILWESDFDTFNRFGVGGDGNLLYVSVGARMRAFKMDTGEAVGREWGELSAKTNDKYRWFRKVSFANGKPCIFGGDYEAGGSTVFEFDPLSSNGLGRGFEMMPNNTNESMTRIAGGGFVIAGHRRKFSAPEIDHGVFAVVGKAPKAP